MQSTRIFTQPTNTDQRFLRVAEKTIECVVGQVIGSMKFRFCGESRFVFGAAAVRHSGFGSKQTRCCRSCLFGIV